MTNNPAKYKVTVWAAPFKEVDSYHGNLDDAFLKAEKTLLGGYTTELGHHEDYDKYFIYEITGTWIDDDDKECENRELIAIGEAIKEITHINRTVYVGEPNEMNAHSKRLYADTVDAAKLMIECDGEVIYD
jgi:hypothetical protein